MSDHENATVYLIHVQRGLRYLRELVADRRDTAAFVDMAIRHIEDAEKLHFLQGAGPGVIDNDPDEDEEDDDPDRTPVVPVPFETEDE